VAEYEVYLFWTGRQYVQAGPHVPDRERYVPASKLDREREVATELALQLQQARAEVERLREWQREAVAVVEYVDKLLAISANPDAAHPTLSAVRKLLAEVQP
jgi:hypothetical protein